MSNKKPDKTDKAAELEELEHRVDAMMNTEQSVDKPVKASSAAIKKTSSLHVISDYEGSQQTAPELPPKLLKGIETGKPSAPKKPSKPAPKPASEEPEPETQAPAEPAEPAVANNDKPTTEISTDPPESASTDPQPAELKPTKSMLEDTETDQAVEDIVIHEGDTQLAVDDALAKRRAEEASVSNEPGLISRFFRSPWTWLFIIGIAGVTYAWFH